MLRRIYEFKVKLYGVEALRAMKDIYSYEEISRMTGLSPQILSRYVTGQFLPNLKRAAMFMELFKKGVLREAVLKNIEVKNGIINNAKLLSNTKLISQIAKMIAAENVGRNVSKVLTKETDGVPIATLVASELEADLIVAKHRKELGVDDFIEVRQVYASGTYSYIYVPRGLLSKKDRVLIVDDIIRSGSTMEALLSLCLEVQAEVVGAYAILGIAEGVESLRRRCNLEPRVIAEITLSKPSSN